MRDDSTKDPRDLYERYVKDLVLVAHHGEQDARSLFLQRWADQLGDVTPHFSHLSDGMQETAFRDSLRARDGGWPESLLGFRLALPRWFVHRVSDPHSAWREHGRRLPTSLALDPVCRAFLEPDRTPWTLEHRGAELHFCSSTCRNLFAARSATARPPVDLGIAL